MDLGTSRTIQRHCVTCTCTPLAASNLGGRPQAGQDRAQHPGMHCELVSAQSFGRAKYKHQTTFTHPARTCPAKLAQVALTANRFGDAKQQWKCIDLLH